MNNIYPFFPGSGAVIVAGAFALMQLVVGVVFGVAVTRDANDRNYRKMEVFLISPVLWGIVVFLSGGLLGVVAYWAIHHSSLSKFAGPK